MGPTIWWPLPRAGKRDEPQQGDIFVLDQGPPHSLFVYMYPGLANPLLDPPTGFGRLAVPFKYEHGFPSHSRVEGVHTGVGERSGGCGFWLYHAPGSGVYLDLGRTQVFAEQWDALVFFTGCDQGAPAENEIEAKTPGNCSAYIKQRTMVVDGRSVLDRPFRREIYLRARARGLDTLQFTHRAEQIDNLTVGHFREADEGHLHGREALTASDLDHVRHHRHDLGGGLASRVAWVDRHTRAGSLLAGTAEELPDRLAQLLASEVVRQCRPPTSH